jgi:hypothetical protein
MIIWLTAEVIEASRVRKSAHTKKKRNGQRETGQSGTWTQHTRPLAFAFCVVVARDLKSNRAKHRWSKWRIENKNLIFFWIRKGTVVASSHGKWTPFR